MPLDSAATDADAPPLTATAGQTAWRNPAIARGICRSCIDSCLAALARVDKSSFKLAIPFLYGTMKLQNIEAVASAVTSSERFIRYVTSVHVLKYVSMSDSAPCMIPKYAFRFPTLLCVCDGDSGIFIKWIRAGTSFTDCEILLAPSGPANVLHMLDVVTPLVPAYWSPQVVCAPWRWAYREEYEYTTLCESHDMLLSSCWVNGRITGLDGAMIEGRLKLWIKGKGWPSRCLAITPQSGADLVKTSHFANMLEQGAQRRACLFLLLADRCPLGTALSACIAHAPLIRRLGTLSIKAVYPGREEMRGLAGIANRAWDDPCLPGPINEHLAIEIDLSPGICTTEAIASLYACQASDTAWLRDLAYILLQLGGPLARYDLILPTLTDLAIHEDIEDDGYRDIRARWNAILQANINTIIEQTRANRPTGWRKIAKKGPRGGYRTRGGRTT